MSRETSPLDSGVVSITLLKGGDGAYNVIPNDVQLGGTIRCALKLCWIVAVAVTVVTG